MPEHTVNEAKMIVKARISTSLDMPMSIIIETGNLSRAAAPDGRRSGGRPGRAVEIGATRRGWFE
jgi:hypothetical protein